MQELSPDVALQVELALGVLKRGGLAAYPTDTVYGLGTRYDDIRAVNRIFLIKKRPSNQGLPLLIGDLTQRGMVAREIPPLAEVFIRHFWPGALTLVLPKSASITGSITMTDSVAVRLPRHPVPKALAIGLGVPLVGTSANLSGRPSAVTANEVKAQLGHRIDFIIDGGRTVGGKESTVIDLTSREPQLLREGAVSRAEITEIVPGIA